MSLSSAVSEPFGISLHTACDGQALRLYTTPVLHDAIYRFVFIASATITRRFPSAEFSESTEGDQPILLHALSSASCTSQRQNGNLIS